MLDRRAFVATIFGGQFGAVRRVDVSILTGRVSGRTPADVEDGLFDLARRTAIAVPPDSAAQRALKTLLGQRVELIMRVGGG